MLLEGLLIEHLSRVPKARRQEWLRTLLVQGYLWEGGVSRRTQRNARPVAGGPVEPKAGAWGKAFAHWLARPQTSVRPMAIEGTAPLHTRPAIPEVQETEKPFAYLRKVIG
jgi:hypothetical protein